MENKTKIAFFGTPDRAVIALEVLKGAGIVPSLVITQPDRPQGRKLVLTPSPVKIWAENEKVPVLQPVDLEDQGFKDILKQGDFDVFIVVAYGKIMKEDILAIPKHGSINLHASLLPKLRGSSPIETAILRDEKDTGVTLILMDKLMDHGPIIAQKKVVLDRWPLTNSELATILVTEGGKLLAEKVPLWIDGKIQAVEQDHTAATLAKKISKEDGLMDLSADGYQNFLKFNAYKGWPGSYYFENTQEGKKRVIITDATFENGTFVIKKMIREGKKEVEL